MKIQITNSPFDFDEVGQKSADRWVRQGKAFYSSDRLSITFDFNFMQRQKARTMSGDDNFDRAVTGSFEWFVGDSGGSTLMKQYEGISGGVRVYQATHGA